MHTITYSIIFKSYDILKDCLDFLSGLVAHWRGYIYHAFCQPTHS